MSIIIRRARQSDAPAMVRYLDALIAERLDVISRRETPTLEDQRELIDRGEISERGLVLVAMDGDDVVGLLDLWAGDRADNRHAGRFGMSVAETRRGQGVGRQLLEAAIAEARAWPGFCRIELEVTPRNGPAVALYARLGFRLEAWKSKALVLADEPEDMLLMALTW